MDQQTHEVKLPSGIVAVLRDSITGADFRQIRAIFQEAKPDAVDLAEDKAMTLIVTSLGGSAENIKDRALALEVKDFIALADALREVRSGRFTKTA